MKGTRLVVMAGALLAACAGGPPPDSGVEGQVWIGPMCPVVQAGTECPDAPFAAVLEVENGAGRTVARGESDGDGSFRIPLAPGDYVLVPQSGEGGMPWAEPVEVRVAAGEWTFVEVHYDSGIR